MEIKNALNSLDPYSKTRLTPAYKQPAKAASQDVHAPQGEGGDRVSLSPEAKLRTEAFTSAMNAPDVRAAKVAELKSRVESGEYVPDSAAIAAKLLAEEPGLFQP